MITMWVVKDSPKFNKDQAKTLQVIKYHLEKLLFEKGLAHFPRYCSHSASYLVSDQPCHFI